MDMGLAYVIGYHPENATIDIRTTDGTTINSLPFDASLSFYGTPVLPIMRTEQATGRVFPIKIGSFALFCRFNDKNVRILRLFNEDQDLLRNFPGHATRLVHGYVQDSLLAMIQDGEALMQAPGRIVETAPDRFERQMGSWLLLKNSGDAILSNANSSCEMWVSNDGQWEVNSTRYRVQGVDTQIYEDDSGSLHMTAGGARGSEIALVFNSDGSGKLSSGTTEMTISPLTYSISSGTVNIYGGDKVAIDTAALEVAAATFTATTDTTNISATQQVSVSAPTVAVAAADVLAVNAGSGMDIVAPRNRITLSEDGTLIDVEREATITIRVGDSQIRIDKDDITLVPAAGKMVKIGEAANQPVLFGNPASPTPSTLLMVEK